jgi:hypothetical protein
MKTAEELSVELLKMSGATDKEIEFCKTKSPNQFKKVQVWIKQIQLDALKAGVISPEPCWICFHSYYMYSHDTLLGLLWQMMTEWNKESHIIG